MLKLILNLLFEKRDETDDVFLHRDSGGILDLTKEETCDILKEGDKDDE